MQVAFNSQHLVWRLEPLETWDEEVARGFELFYNEARVAQLLPFRYYFRWFDAWYWLVEYHGPEGLLWRPRKTSLSSPVMGFKEARKACETYVEYGFANLKQVKNRLSWVKAIPDPNLAISLSPPPGGKFLLDDKAVVGEVKPFRVRFGEYKGWYWTAFPPNLKEFSHFSLTPTNTKANPVGTLQEAKTACAAYLRKQLLSKAR